MGRTMAPTGRTSAADAPKKVSLTAWTSTFIASAGSTLVYAELDACHAARQVGRQESGEVRD